MHRRPGVEDSFRLFLPHSFPNLCTTSRFPFLFQCKCGVKAKIAVNKVDRQGGFIPDYCSKTESPELSLSSALLEIKDWTVWGEVLGHLCLLIGFPHRKKKNLFLSSQQEMVFTTWTKAPTEVWFLIGTLSSFISTFQRTALRSSRKTFLVVKLARGFLKRFTC